MRRVARVWMSASSAVVIATCGIGSVESCASDGRADPPRTRDRSAGAVVAPTTSDTSPWSSPEACESAVRARRTRARRAGHAAIATWNVRWFPDGVPFGSREPPMPTNVEWLACAIAWLSVDVIALQEIQAHPAAVDVMARVISSLDARTGGRWRIGRDACNGASFQHVALLWDSQRVTASELRTIDAINPHGAACRGWLRPGFGGRMRFAGGLDVHVVSVHLKSGDDARSRDLRRRSHAALPDAFAALQTIARDDDVIFAGDFNTHGCARCAPAETSDAELATLDVARATFAPGLRRVPAEPRCSYYGGGRASFIDHFVATRSMREIATDVRARAEGVCGERACARVPRRVVERALRELSDHCPVVLEIADRDID